MSVLSTLNSQSNAIIAQTRQALVRVHQGERGQGAGTIWDTNGIILTNAHVVGNGEDISVTLHDGQRHDAQVMAYDADLDIAALVVDAKELPTIALGNSRELSVGTWVMAIGHPWGVVGAVTSGTVIGSGSFLPEMPKATQEWIAVGLKMRPGHSGGALVDGFGRLLGINTMISGPSVGLAIPVHVVKGFLQRSRV